MKPAGSQLSNDSAAASTTGAKTADEIVGPILQINIFVPFSASGRLATAATDLPRGILRARTRQLCRNAEGGSTFLSYRPRTHSVLAGPDRDE